MPGAVQRADRRPRSDPSGLELCDEHGYIRYRPNRRMIARRMLPSLLSML